VVSSAQNFSWSNLTCFSTGLGPRIIPFSRDIIKLGVGVLRDTLPVKQGGFEQVDLWATLTHFQERFRPLPKTPWLFFRQFSILSPRFGELRSWRAFFGFTLIPLFWGPPAKSAPLPDAWHPRRLPRSSFRHISRFGPRYRVPKPE